MPKVVLSPSFSPIAEGCYGDVLPDSLNLHSLTLYVFATFSRREKVPDLARFLVVFIEEIERLIRAN